MSHFFQTHLRNWNGTLARTADKSTVPTAIKNSTTEPGSTGDEEGMNTARYGTSDEDSQFCRSKIHNAIIYIRTIMKYGGRGREGGEGREVRGGRGGEERKGREGRGGKGREGKEGGRELDTEVMAQCLIRREWSYFVVKLRPHP
jgi:hypothetical protein